MVFCLLLIEHAFLKQTSPVSRTTQPTKPKPQSTVTCAMTPSPTHLGPHRRNRAEISGVFPFYQNGLRDQKGSLRRCQRMQGLNKRLLGPSYAHLKNEPNDILSHNTCLCTRCNPGNSRHHDPSQFHHHPLRHHSRHHPATRGGIGGCAFCRTRPKSGDRVCRPRRSHQRIHLCRVACRAHCQSGPGRAGCVGRSVLSDAAE